MSRTWESVESTLILRSYQYSRQGYLASYPDMITHNTCGYKIDARGVCRKSEMVLSFFKQMLPKTLGPRRLLMLTQNPQVPNLKPTIPTIPNTRLDKRGKFRQNTGENRGNVASEGLSSKNDCFQLPGHDLSPIVTVSLALTLGLEARELKPLF